MAKLKGLTAKVEPHHRYKTAHQIYDVNTQASRKSPRKIAEATLKKIAGDLKIKPDLSRLKFDKVRESILGSHVLYQQYHNGKPISGAWIRVDVDKDGRVFNIHNDLVSEPAMVKTRKAKAKRSTTTQTKQLSASEAKALAIKAAAPAKGDATRIVSSELCYYKHNGLPTLLWKVIVKTTPPRSAAKARRPAEWKIYVDAVTGAILDKHNLLRFIDGKGSVFDPNPVVTLNDTSLEDNSSIPNKAYTEVVLRDLKTSGFIEGPYVTTKTTRNRIKRKNRDFRFKGTDRAFKEVMVYFHIEVPGFGQSGEGGAMGEGFGDFLAASFFSDVKPKNMKPTVGNWDATAYSGAEPPFLRPPNPKRRGKRAGTPFDEIRQNAIKKRNGRGK